MSEIQFDLAASAKKRRYNKTTTIETPGAPLDLKIYAPASYDGKTWHIHDDEICLTISELGEYNDKGEWEDNPDCMNSADGQAWVTLTPETAKKMARALLHYASKCRRASEVDTTDPELIESCRACQEQLQAAWDSETAEEKAEAERQVKAFEDMLPPELRKAWE